MDEEKEARALAAQTLQMRKERLRESNERAAKVREQQLISGINPMTGRCILCSLDRILFRVGSIANQKTADDCSIGS